MIHLVKHKICPAANSLVHAISFTDYDLYIKSGKYPYKETQSSIRNPLVIPGTKKVNVDPNLNPDYNFGNYVEGECNILARSTGIVVGNNTGGKGLNPFIIYGDSGLGKTHLAQAIGLLVKEKYPYKNVLFVNANKFHTHYVESLRNNFKNDFINFYQMIDILILDDVHELAGREKTQEIFFQIFAHLCQSGKQLIITCDRTIVEYQGIKQKLLSGFKWGLQADLQRPDYETRLAILKKRGHNIGIVFPVEILEFLAVNVSKNIKELEIVLISLHAQSLLNRKKITLDQAKQIVKNLSSTEKYELTIEYIQKIVSDYFKIPFNLIQGKTRKKEIVQARQVSMFFSNKLTKETLASIGSLIGGKSHATLIHACKTVYKLIGEDAQFSNQIKDLEKRLKLLIL